MQHALSTAQRKALRALATCRTSVLGGRVEVCTRCGDEKVIYNSCRNRHCPACQSLAQAKWMDGRLARLLPTDYFHVVFTVPDALLGALAMSNREVFFDALFAAGSQTLLELGEDPKRLGAQLGLTAVLHTWTRDLRFHPHLHCIVTGGGLTRGGEPRWKASKRDYLFPVRVLSALFRGKLTAALEAALLAGELDLRGVDGFGGGVPDDLAWKRLKRKLYSIKWVSYAKPPFAGAESVYQYLGRYTHRVGISNHRLVGATEDAVTFRTRGDATATMHPHEFLRRFLQHVLPSGFVKLRHYGLLAPGNVNTKLVIARALLQREPPTSPIALATPAIAMTEPEDWRARLLRLTGRDVTRCEKCGGLLSSRPLDRPAIKDSS